MRTQATVVEKKCSPIQIKTIELDELKTNEVLIKTVATGICHTDIAGRDMGMAPYPVALGH